MLYLVKVFQFYSFIVLWPPLILGNNKYCNFRGVRGPENIEKRSSRIPENFEIPEGIGFPEKVEIRENFENSATVYYSIMLYIAA